MKLLLDESIPIRLANYFPVEIEVSTVVRMGWTGMKNGVLLRHLVAEGFGALVTADQGIAYQQNLAALGTRVVILVASRNRLQELAPLVPKVVELLRDQSSPGAYRVSA